MKFYTKLLAISALSVGISISMSSCGDDRNFVGNWEAVSPANLSESLPGASSALVTPVIDFKPGADKSEGDVTMSFKYEINQTLSTDSAGLANLSADITAVARASGKWTYDVDDEDDLLLTFDYSTINVELQPSMISFDPATDMDEKALTDLAEKWKKSIEISFRTLLGDYSVIEDIEINKKTDILTFEIKNPDREMHFKRAIP